MKTLDYLGTLGTLSRLDTLEELNYLQHIGSIGSIGTMDYLGTMGTLQTLDYLGSLVTLQWLGTLNYLHTLPTLIQLQTLQTLGTLGTLGTLSRLDTLEELNYLQHIGSIGSIDALDRLLVLGTNGSGNVADISGYVSPTDEYPTMTNAVALNVMDTLLYKGNAIAMEDDLSGYATADGLADEATARQSADDALQTAIDSATNTASEAGTAAAQAALLATSASAAANEAKSTAEGKQDKLTAGENITISEDNVISTDLSYYRETPSVPMRARMVVSEDTYVALSLNVSDDSGAYIYGYATDRADKYSEWYQMNDAIFMRVADGENKTSIDVYPDRVTINGSQSAVHTDLRAPALVTILDAYYDSGSGTVFLPSSDGYYDSLVSQGVIVGQFAIGKVNGAVYVMLVTEITDEGITFELNNKISS